MEGIVGGRGCVETTASAEQQPRTSATVARLFCDLRSESAEQTLFTLAALDHCEQRLLDALRHGYHISQTDDVPGYL